VFNSIFMLRSPIEAVAPLGDGTFPHSSADGHGVCNLQT
jgi:hypothetical protein